MLTFGGQVRRAINVSAQNRFTAFLTGLGVTSILQSSTATALMTASFLDKGLLSLTASIAVLIGADLSTTLVAQLLTLDMGWLAPTFLFFGGVLALKKSSTETRRHAIGNVLVGLGLVLLSLSLIREASAPLKSSSILADILALLDADPLMAVTFAALITVFIHSSLATVLFFVALSSQGIIPLTLGLWLIIGANIGGAFIPYLITRKQGVQTRQLMTANIIMRLAIALLCTLGFSWLSPALSYLTDEPARTLVAFHTLYNLVLCLLFLPTCHLLSDCVSRFIKPAPSGTSQQQSHLNDALLGQTDLALTSAVRETLRMIDLIRHMTEMSLLAIKQNNATLIQEAKRADDELDAIFKKVTSFLTKIHPDTLTHEEATRYALILNFATTLEHSGDIIQNSLTKTIAKKINLQQNFSDEGWKEINSFYTLLLRSVDSSQSVFISHSQPLSEEMLLSRQNMKTKERLSRSNHFSRIRDKNPQSLVTRDIHIDLIRDLVQINGHLTQVAYDVINHASEENKG